MSCMVVREQWELFADGALPEAEAALLRRHVEICEACRAYVRASEELARAIRDCVSEAAAAPRRGPGIERARFSGRREAAGRRLFAAAASLALVLGAATYLGVETIRARGDVAVRAEALRAAERVLESMLARGITPRDVGERAVPAEAGVMVRVRGGPDLYEVCVSVRPPAGGERPAAELAVIWGAGRRAPEREVRP